MNDQVCVAPFSGSGGCNSGGGVVVNVGDGGGGGADGTFSGAASSILPIVDFSTLTPTQKAQIAALVTPGVGGAEGVLDGIGSAFDINTITPVQKAAITAIVAAGLDFSTLSAAQKAQIQAIAGAGAGTGGTLTAAQLSALMTTLFTPGATGSILQKQADGTIQAVPFLSTIPNGTAVGDGLVWNNVTKKWEVAPVTISQAGLKATIAAAPDSTVANPLVEVLGADSAGNPVVAKRQALPITDGLVIGTNPINFPLVAGGDALIASVKAPAKGRYMLRFRSGYGIDPITTEPQGAKKRMTANIVVASASQGRLYQSTFISNRAAIEPVSKDSANFDAYGSILGIGSAGPIDLAANEEITMNVLTAQPTVPAHASGLILTQYFVPFLQLVKIADDEIIDI
jgi:hypothetical protein